MYCHCVGRKDSGAVSGVVSDVPTRHHTLVLDTAKHHTPGLGSTLHCLGTPAGARQSGATRLSSLPVDSECTKIKEGKVSVEN